MSKITVQWLPPERTSKAEREQILAAKSPAEIYSAIKLTATGWDAKDAANGGVPIKFSQDAFETTITLDEAIALHGQLCAMLAPAGTATATAAPPPKKPTTKGHS